MSTDHGHDHDDHDHATPDPVPEEEVHDNSWSANLETPDHAEDRDLVVAEGIAAVERTAPGYHVNLVTHGAHGHPAEYLFDALEGAFGDAVEWEYVEQCGCGGHVTRVHIGDPPRYHPCPNERP